MRGPERKLFVEGGGNRNKKLQTQCREAFRTMLERSGLRDRMPRIIACGRRSNAYAQFKTAMQGLHDGDVAVLLVDSEAPVEHSSPWEHVGNRKDDRWKKPPGATDDHLHLMVQSMESWLLADRESMAAFFGPAFDAGKLPSPSKPIEAIRKDELSSYLEKATKESTRGAYHKGKHSFALLCRIDPARVREASPWAKRLFETLDRLLVGPDDKKKEKP